MNIQKSEGRRVADGAQPEGQADPGAGGQEHGVCTERSEAEV